MDEEDLEALEELEKRIAPGPWFHGGGSPIRPYMVAQTWRLLTPLDVEECTVTYGRPTGGGAYFTADRERAKANAEFIAEVRSAFPKLLATIRDQQRRIDDLEQQLFETNMGEDT